MGKKITVRKTQPDLIYNDVEEILISLTNIENSLQEREIRLTENYLNQLGSSGGRIYGASPEGGITY